jgi:hypothetical protein
MAFWIRAARINERAMQLPRCAEDYRVPSLSRHARTVDGGAVEVVFVAVDVGKVETAHHQSRIPRPALEKNVWPLA